MCEEHGARISALELHMVEQSQGLARIEGMLAGTEARLIAMDKKLDPLMALVPVVAVLKADADKREARRGVTVAAWLTGAAGLVASLLLHLFRIRS
jgi:uncharacterized coiled-coil protein SlyX